MAGCTSRRVGVLAGVVGAALAATPGRAAASPLFELVGDAQGRGGLTARISADGAAAAYFNPSLLADAAPTFDLGTFFVVETIGITLDGRSSSPLCAGGACDVPSVGGRGPESYRHESDGSPIANPTMPTSWLEDGTDELSARPRQGDGSGHNSRAYQTIGLITPILRGRIVLGMFAMIPLGEFTTASAFYNDEREQFFSNSLHPELYADRMTATSLAFGGGFHVHPDVSLGATFTLSLANHAAAPVYVSNLNDLDTVLLDSKVAVEASVAPHVGATWTPSRRLRLAGTVHTPQKFEIDTSFTYILATGQEQQATLKFVHSFMPLTIAAAGSYALGDLDGAAPRWTLTGVASWAQWSHYIDRHGERPSGEYAWSDTLSAAVGARLHLGRTAAWLDATYQPSPVPPQTGRTNYVDNDRIGLAAGADHEVSLWGSRFRIGIDVVGHVLPSSHVTKFTAPADAGPDDYPALVRDEVPDDAIDVLGAPVPNREGLQTNNPGFPGFGSSGIILGGGFHVAVIY